MNYKYLTIGLSALLCLACSEEVELPVLPQIEGTTTGIVFDHQCAMHLDGSCTGFDGDATRAGSIQWNDGDRIYLCIDSSVYGQGEYSSNDASWQFSYTGNLANVSTDKCSVYYLPGSAEPDSDYAIALDANTPVYAATEAKFQYAANFNELTVQAKLQPMVWRMRFSDMQQGETFSINEDEQLRYPASFDLRNGSVSYRSGSQSVAYDGNGYSSIIYAAPFDGEAVLKLQTSDGLFSRSLSSSLARAGKSGQLVTPRAEAYNGWTKVELVAKLVDGPDFNERIITLANGRKLEWTEEDNWHNDQKIKSIVFEYQSDKTSATLVSTDDSPFPIYASFENGTITISTPAQKFELISTNGMFRDCSALTSLNLSSFDTRSVTDMSWMFYRCCALTSLNISSFDTSSVTDMSGMFSGCSALISLNISNFDTRSVTYMNSMFSECYALTSLNISNFDTRSVTSMFEMFSGCDELTSLNISNFDTRSVTNMSWMFSRCCALTSLNISNFDTSSVTDMSGMFYNCYALTSLNISNFDTRSVTYMNRMFQQCSALTSLNLSNFDTSSVNDMSWMFCNCYALTSLNISNFDTRSVTNMADMLYYCSGLTDLNLGYDFTMENASKSEMCVGLANNSRACTITCIKATKDALSSGAELNNDYITWNILSDNNIGGEGFDDEEIW